MRALLNIYGQDEPGDCVIIIGNRSGLKALRKALKNKGAKKSTAKVCASDGTEYELRIYAGDPEGTIGGAGRQFWKELAYPYHERLKAGTFISPWEWD